MKELGLSKVAHGTLGASVTDGGCEFRVWAPNAKQVRIQLWPHAAGSPQTLAMERAEGGHFVLETSARPGDRYFYIVDDHQPVPDSVSRLLPQGVHGPTEIVDPEKFPWTDAACRRAPDCWFQTVQGIRASDSSRM